eukprot:234537_1
MQTIEEEMRAHWCIGSLCLIYSRSKTKWFKGKITSIYSETNEEWLRVKYGANFHKTKSIQRYSKYIIPIIEDQSSLFRKGSICSIYSYTTNSWCNGEVMKIFSDKDGEWMKVTYEECNVTMVCDIQRYSNDIRLLQTTANTNQTTKLNQQHKLVCNVKEISKCASAATIIRLLECYQRESYSVDIDQVEILNHLFHIKYDHRMNEDDDLFRLFYDHITSTG